MAVLATCREQIRERVAGTNHAAEPRRRTLRRLEKISQDVLDAAEKHAELKRVAREYAAFAESELADDDHGAVDLADVLTDTRKLPQFDGLKRGRMLLRYLGRSRAPEIHVWRGASPQARALLTGWQKQWSTLRAAPIRRCRFPACGRFFVPRTSEKDCPYCRRTTPGHVQRWRAARLRRIDFSARDDWS